jgi:hypothetical protein
LTSMLPSGSKRGSRVPWPRRATGREVVGDWFVDAPVHQAANSSGSTMMVVLTRRPSRSALGA